MGKQSVELGVREDISRWEPKQSTNVENKWHIQETMSPVQLYGLGGHLCIAVQPRCSWASTAQGPASSVRKGADQHQLWLPELHGFPHQCVCCGSLEVESWGGREERGLAPRTQISQTSETGFGGSIQTTDGMLFGALVLIT